MSWSRPAVSVINEAWPLWQLTFTWLVITATWEDLVPIVCRHFTKWGLEIFLSVVFGLGFRKEVNVNRRHDSWDAMVLCCVVLFIEGRTRGSLVALFTDQKVTNHESRISNFHFSFESYNQHVKYRFSSCSYAKKW